MLLLLWNEKQEKGSHKPKDPNGRRLDKDVAMPHFF